MMARKVTYKVTYEIWGKTVVDGSPNVEATKPVEQDVKVWSGEDLRDAQFAMSYFRAFGTSSDKLGRWSVPTDSLRIERVQEQRGVVE